MTVRKMPDQPGPASTRDMKSLSAEELSTALAGILHEKTGNYYVVHIDQITFSKDPNAYDGGSFAARFERNISAERKYTDDIVEELLDRSDG